MPKELITIEGLDEVCDLLQRAPKQAVPRALLAGLTAWARVMEVAIVTVTPRRAVRSGGDRQLPELFEDLQFTVTLDPDSVGGYVEVGFGDELGLVARFVEYGHREVGARMTRAAKELMRTVDP